MEHLSEKNVCLLNSVNDVSMWSTSDIMVGIFSYIQTHFFVKYSPPVRNNSSFKPCV